MAASTEGTQNLEPELQLNFAERLASLKVGVVAGFGAALAFIALALFNEVGFARYWDDPELHLAQLSWGSFVSWTIATVSGFLFGITYRYITRHDRNPHLRSGAVLAFGLVRGCAQIESGLHADRALMPLLLIAAESVLLFAIVRWFLDRAFDQGWLQPFPLGLNRIE